MISFKIISKKIGKLFEFGLSLVIMGFFLC